MLKRAFIVHGWEGTPAEGWFPWLKRELEKKGFRTKVPAMPNTLKPKIETWTPHLKKLIGKPNEHTCLVGHSMGCQTILRYLASLTKGLRVGGVVMVAGFVNLKNLTKEEQVIAEPWLTTAIDLKKVRSHAGKITAVFSSNDPWVPLSNSKIFKNKLGAKIIVMKNKGHFSGDDGIKELPVVLKEVLKMSSG